MDWRKIFLIVQQGGSELGSKLRIDSRENVSDGVGVGVKLEEPSGGVGVGV